MRLGGSDHAREFADCRGFRSRAGRAGRRCGKYSGCGPLSSCGISHLGNALGFRMQARIAREKLAVVADALVLRRLPNSVAQRRRGAINEPTSFPRASPRAAKDFFLKEVRRRPLVCRKFFHARTRFAHLVNDADVRRFDSGAGKRTIPSLGDNQRATELAFARRKNLPISRRLFPHRTSASPPRLVGSSAAEADPVGKPQESRRTPSRRPLRSVVGRAVRKGSSRSERFDARRGDSHALAASEAVRHR